MEVIAGLPSLHSSFGTLSCQVISLLKQTCLITFLKSCVIKIFCFFKKYSKMADGTLSSSSKTQNQLYQIK